MALEDVTIGQIVATVIICQTLIGFIEKIFEKFMRPRNAMEKSIDEQKRRTDRIETDINSINKRLASVSNDNKMIMKTNLEIMQHMITGNHVEDMQKTIKELQEYLIEK